MLGKMIAYLAAVYHSVSWHDAAAHMGHLPLVGGYLRKTTPRLQSGCWEGVGMTTWSGNVKAWKTTTKVLGTGKGLRISCFGGAVTCSSGEPVWEINIVATDASGASVTYPATNLVNASDPYATKFYTTAVPEATWRIDLINDDWVYSMDYNLRFTYEITDDHETPEPPPPQPPVYDEATARIAMVYAAAAYNPPYSVKDWLVSDACQAAAPNFTNRTVFSVAGEGIYEPFGYTGLDHDRQLIVAAFKGTNNTDDILADLVQALKGALKYEAECHLNENVWGHAHSGFCKHYQLLQAKTDLIQNVLGWMAAYPSYKVLSTGHSMGASIAHLFKVDMVARMRVGAHPEWAGRFMAYTLGEPRTGDYQFGMNTEPYFRVVHKDDIIAHLVPCCATKGRCRKAETCPYHARTEVWYKDTMNPGDAYKVCSVEDGEDESCSDSQSITLSVDHHKHYFGVQVGLHCYPPTILMYENHLRREAGLPPM